MKNKKILPILLCAFGSCCALAGCDNTEEKKNEIKINSLYDGFAVMYQTKNYTLEIVRLVDSYREEIPDMLFTANYIGYDKQFEDLDILYNDSNGIYHVCYKDDYFAGEYIKDKLGNKYTNLWDNSLVPTMFNEGGKYIKANVTKDINEITITDKAYKLKFLETITGSVTSYVDVDSLTAKYENNRVIFNLSIGQGKDSYKITLKNAGTTESAHLNTFIKNGGQAFVPNKDLSEMQRLFNLDNFVQRIYMINGDEHYWSGFAFFTPHYYFPTGSNTSIGTAYIEFNYKEVEELENDFDLRGIYMVSVGESETGEMEAGLVSSRAYNADTLEIEECYHYPSRYLDLLRNLEYVKSGEIRNANYEETKVFFPNGSNKYFVTDENLVKNFVSNFSLESGFQGVTFKTVGIEIALAEADKDSIICFHAIGDYGAQPVDVLIPFTGFGDAQRSVLDILYSQYNNAN